MNKLFATHIDPGAWAGKPIEKTPAIGAVALFGGDHVAFVEKVVSRDAIEVTELSERALVRRTVTRGAGWPHGFVLLGPRPTEMSTEPSKPSSGGGGTFI